MSRFGNGTFAKPENALKRAVRATQAALLRRAPVIQGPGRVAHCLLRSCTAGGAHQRRPEECRAAGPVRRHHQQGTPVAPARRGPPALGMTSRRAVSPARAARRARPVAQGVAVAWGGRSPVRSGPQLRGRRLAAASLFWHLPAHLARSPPLLSTAPPHLDEDEREDHAQVCRVRACLLPKNWLRSRWRWRLSPSRRPARRLSPPRRCLACRPTCRRTEPLLFLPSA
jgi:hypothetical protein